MLWKCRFSMINLQTPTFSGNWPLNSVQLIIYIPYHPHSLSILFCFHSCNICFHFLCPEKENSLLFPPKKYSFQHRPNGYRIRRPEGSVGDHILGQLAWGGHVGLLWSPSRPARNKVARLELRGCRGQWWEMVKKGWLDSNGWVFIDTSIVYWYIPGSQLQNCPAHKQNVGQAEIKIGTYFPKLICNCFNRSRLELMMVFLTRHLSCLPRNSISFTSWTPTLGYLEGMLWMSKISEEKEKVNMWAKNMRQNYGLKVAKLLIG